MAQDPEVQPPKALPFTLVPRPPAVICAEAVFHMKRENKPKTDSEKHADVRYLMPLLMWQKC
jgi:hypothetical protein